MKKNKKDNLFSNPRWNQDPGAVMTAETFQLTKEEKKYLAEQDKKWKKTLNKLKTKRKNTK